MERGTIKKSIDVKAPASKVWNVLTQDKFNRIWYAAFMEGSYAVTDWQQGSKVTFLDGDKNGVFGKIVELKPNEKISMRYEGVVENGQETTTSDDAKQWIGATEIYSLSNTNGNTSILVELEGPVKFMEMCTPLWDKALQKIKGLSEE
ncbi:SRPBCC family protein [Pinibacter aurantiacus]|uniref:SRPBCC domain-containing protein n=1 Tax=Pinibacter aurantiacus TaxID=2851599 RepID=A0A9E2S4A9_9BACT|nr:SRPBCC domain-containing protein [Pinibacter aurantiacus]MBV4356273.1 SRPBCC domain-containing protein [Pinibacter aurantiacus]